MKEKYFIIAYIDGTDRKQITLIEIEEYNYDSEAWQLYHNKKTDLASRKRFTWFEKESHDDEDHDSQSSREEQENEAATYARQLAANHDLEFIGSSNTDGIMD